VGAYPVLLLIRPNFHSLMNNWPLLTLHLTAATLFGVKIYEKQLFKDYLLQMLCLQHVG
jgi:hypothetical protein